VAILVTGSAGHLGEAVVRVLRAAGRPVVGMDLRSSPFTDVVGSICDADTVATAMAGVEAVVHSATLHKPHIGTHTVRDFIETNIAGTSTLLDAAASAGVGSFVFVSTTSAFGRALRPGGSEPAAWITEEVVPQPRNIYGVTKAAAEDLCRLAHQDRGLAVAVLRMSRFFPEDDDDEATTLGYSTANAKVNELLYRRVDLSDAVDACLAAVDRAPQLGFGKWVISATTPFDRSDVAVLRRDAPGVLHRYFPDYEEIYAALGWRMFPSLDRVYDSTAARRDLAWEPRYDFAHALADLADGRDPFSELSRQVGRKGYHSRPTGVYTA
jgi:UDP-glucose 4-epimerase